MFTVKIDRQAVRNRQTSNGQMTLQKMQIDGADGFPIVFEQVVEQPYPNGTYSFVPTLRNDNWGGLEMNRYEFKLTPVSAPGQSK